MSATSAQSDFSVLQSPRGVVYSHHRHLICSRLKNSTQTACVHQLLLVLELRIWSWACL